MILKVTASVLFYRRLCVLLKGNCSCKLNQYQVKVFRDSRVVWLCGIFFLSAILRLWHLGKQSLWMDEAFSFWVASHSVHEIMQILRYDAHPPLYYVLLHLWQKVGTMELSLRLVSVICGVANSLIIFSLGEKLIGRRGAILAAVFWACAFNTLNQETQVRMYALATTFSMLTTLFAWMSYKTDLWRHRILYVTFAGLALFTHYYTGFIILAQLLFLLLKGRYKLVLTAFFALSAAFAFWAHTFSVQVHNAASKGMPNISLGDFLLYFGQLFTFNYFQVYYQALIVAFFTIALVVSGFLHLLKGQKAASLLLGFLVALSVVLPGLIAKLTPYHIIAFRYMILFSPYVFLLFFYEVSRAPKYIELACFGVLLFINIFIWVNFLTGPSWERQNWREAASVLRQSINSGDAVFIQQGIFPLGYYLPDLLKVSRGDGYVLSNPSQKQINVRWYNLDGEASLHEVILATRHSNRQWLVLSQETLVDPQEKILKWLLENRNLASMYKIRSIYSGDDIRIGLFMKKI